MSKVAILDNDSKSLDWLRQVLVSAFNSAAVSGWLRKRAISFACHIPDWLVETWARVTGVDFATAHTLAPELPQQLESEAGRELVRDYIEARHVVPTVRSLRRLVTTVLTLVRLRKLPIEADKVEQSVAALALVGCTPLSGEFVAEASSILDSSSYPEHLLSAYEQTLNSADETRLNGIANALRGEYGYWVANRLQEARRYLGLDYPIFRIHFGERTPQWDALWGNIIKGGTDD